MVAATWLALFFSSTLALGQLDLRPSQRAKEVPADLPPDEASVARLYLKVLPAVVAVYGETDKAAADRLDTTRSHGGGVVISKSGQILTAAHVLDGEERILVRTQDGIERPANLLLVDTSADLALLELAEAVANLASATLGDSDQLAVGQRVIVIGSPFGLVNSLSVGHISGFHELHTLGDDGTNQTAEFLQTDAAINLGNSGGPLFDSAGRLVAIASSYWTANGGSGGVGFATTINTAIEHFQTLSRLARADGSQPNLRLPDTWREPNHSQASYPRDDD
jgi:S1-C subfamily serine protease